MSKVSPREKTRPLFPSPWNGAVLGAFMGWFGGLLLNGVIFGFVGAVLSALVVGWLESLTARYDRG